MMDGINIFKTSAVEKKILQKKGLGEDRFFSEMCKDMFCFSVLGLSVVLVIKQNLALTVTQALLTPNPIS